MAVGIGSWRATIERYHRVTDASFRAYQTATGNGGDFVIFTDVMPLSAGRAELRL